MSRAFSAPVRRFIGRVQTLPGGSRTSAIVKQEVFGPLAIGPLGCAGDEQADRRVHGGPDKAVHFYPADHFAALAAHFPEAAARLVPGSIGENLSATGLDEHSVHLGDVFALGAIRLEVCQPRQPCWKIDARYGVDGITVFIAESGRTGWYLRVLEPGIAEPGEPLTREHHAAGAPTLADLWSAWSAHRPELEQLARFVACPALSANWQRKIAERLAWLEKQPGAA